MTPQEVQEIIKIHHSRIGQKGGNKTKKRGSAYYKRIQKKSVAARRRNKELSTGTI